MKQNKNWYFITSSNLWINLDFVRIVYIDGCPLDKCVPVHAEFSDGSVFNLNIFMDYPEAEEFLDDFAKENGWKE